MKKIVSVLLSASLVLSLGMTIPGGPAKAATIKLNKTSLKLTVGESSKLKVKGTSKKVKWTSSKKSVATVSSAGKVLAKKAGTATITAKVAQKKYKCKVTVSKSTVGTKENPISAYEKYTFNYYEEGKKKGKFRIQLLDFVSGDEAAEMAKSNSTNPVPTDTQEYIYFKFQIHYLSGDQSINAKDLFDYYHNIYGEDSTVQMVNLDWGLFFEPIEDIYSAVLQPGNNITCGEAILVNKGYEPFTYKIQTGKNSYTWFTTDLD